MKKLFALLAVLVLAALLIFGCARGGGDYNYATGYAAYGQQGNPYQQQGYVGGGCGVAGPDLSEPLDNSEPMLAA
jgi:hypothetical protein|tara:strand:- start:543 stop:767 length:225 start_codon:yes stop_codon:yes gene_type:complete